MVHRQKEIVDQIKSLLSSCNPVVLHADTGLDGLLTSRVERFDLIICGTDLPVVTGFELVRSIRTNSVNRGTHIIFLSDIVDHKTQHLGSALGVAGMLAMKDVEGMLADIVKKHIKIEPDKIWKDLISSPSMN